MYRWSGSIAAACAVLTVTLLGGCSFQRSVAADEVAKQVEERLEKQVGQQADSVTCADDLAAKRGATVRCSLTDDSTTYGVTAKVTSVDGNHVKFNIQVDQKPERG